MTNSNWESYKLCKLFDLPKSDVLNANNRANNAPQSILSIFVILSRFAQLRHFDNIYDNMYLVLADTISDII